tara:strand:- start:287 stop:568 length:282 start_codon:yes stop_codon:yes gene_type:complete
MIKLGSLVSIDHEVLNASEISFKNNDIVPDIKTVARMGVIGGVHQDRFDRYTHSVVFLDNGELYCARENELTFIEQTGEFLIKLLEDHFNIPK